MIQKNRNEMGKEKSEIFTAENDPVKMEWNVEEKRKSSLHKMFQEKWNEMKNEKSEILTAENDSEKQERN